MNSCQQKEKTEELNNKHKEKNARISENKQRRSENIKESSKNVEQTGNKEHENSTEESERKQTCLKEKRECPDNEKQENTKHSEETQARRILRDRILKNKRTKNSQRKLKLDQKKISIDRILRNTGTQNSQQKFKLEQKRISIDQILKNKKTKNSQRKLKLDHKKISINRILRNMGTQNSQWKLKLDQRRISINRILNREDNTAEESKRNEQEKPTHQFKNDKQTGQETVKSGRNCQTNGKKRKQNELDSNDSTNDFCSTPKRSVYKPSEAAVKFVQDRSALPFPCASRKFYFRQNKKAIHNVSRTKRCQQLPVVRDNTKLIGLQRSKVEGSLEQNLESIKKEIKSCTNKTRHAELCAVADVAMELQKSILLATSKAAAIYKKKKLPFLIKNKVCTSVRLTRMRNYQNILILPRPRLFKERITLIQRISRYPADKFYPLASARLFEGWIALSSRYPADKVIQVKVGSITFIQRIKM